MREYVSRIPCKSWYILLFLFPVAGLKAQNGSMPLLEREVSFSVQNQTIVSVLDLIAEQSGVVFSYNPNSISAGSKVSLSLQNKSVRYAINTLFKDEITYKVKGKYIILKAESGSSKELPDKKIEGYIYDSGTGKRLSDASVYDKDLTISAVTDKYGYFTMEIPVNKPLTAIQVSKIGYSDTALLHAEARSLRTVEMSLHPDDNRKNQDLSFLTKVPNWLVPKQTLTNSQNITKSVFKAVQLSFLPTISTNHFLRGNAVNTVSINMLAGYVQGVRLFEIGGLVNLVKEDAQYVQIGGIGNVVGNQFKGFQVAGIFNTTHTMQGFQAAGILNHVANRADFQLSGIYNHSQSGISQTAGIVNICQESQVQIAGIANTSKMAAFQISGLINRAGYVRHLQLSLINIADSTDGISIGLFSFIKNGYHKLEISTDEIFPISVSFHSGIAQLHTLVSMGMNPFVRSGSNFHLGYGIGSSFGKSRKIQYTIDFTGREVFSKNDLSFDNHLYQIYAGLEKPVTPKLSIVAGLTFNCLLYSNDQATNSLASSLPPYEFITNTFANGHIAQSWIGFRMGIRLF